MKNIFIILSFFIFLMNTNAQEKQHPDAIAYIEKYKDIAIAEMKRVLKPGGKLLLTTRFVFPLHDVPNDYFRFTKYGLQHLLKDGWEIIELEDETSTKDTIAALLQRIGFRRRACDLAAGNNHLFWGWINRKNTAIKITNFLDHR